MTVRVLLTPSSEDFRELREEGSRIKTGILDAMELLIPEIISYIRTAMSHSVLQGRVSSRQLQSVFKHIQWCRKQGLTHMGQPAPLWHSWGSSILRRRRSPVEKLRLSSPHRIPGKARRHWTAPTSSTLLQVGGDDAIQATVLAQVH